MKKNVIIVLVAVFVISIVSLVFGKKSPEEAITPEDVTIENLNDAFPKDEELALMDQESVEPDSFTKIDEDSGKGEITLDEMYTYKLISMFGADNLPEKYSSDNVNNLRGDRIIMMIREDWDKLKPETQKDLELFILPFTDEKSFFYHSNYQLREEIINNLVK